MGIIRGTHISRKRTETTEEVGIYEGTAEAVNPIAAALILGGIITPYHILILFGLLYVLTLLMKKDVVVTERGVETFYQMRITTHYEFWPWKEILSVTTEDRNHPELVALHFARGNRSKRLFYPKADAKQIVVLAKKKNSRIVTANMKPKTGNSKKR